MKILLVGGGGREHALAWKIAQSPLVEHLWAAPGNPGIAKHARCLDLTVDDAAGLAGFAAGHDVDLVVVGPETPLVAGLADRLRARGLAVFGPGKRAAAIEGSKAFSKDLMQRHGIPTARFATLTEPAAARRYARELGAPLVVKTDGLAAGKGAIVCRTLEEADAAIAQCMERREFGAAGATVVVEEFMEGEEASFFALSSGASVLALAAAQDHKTVFDDDRGPNTGGMGAYSPVASVDARMHARVMAEIVEPTLAALAAEGAPYHGVLYAGLMLTKEGPKVVEFNCRFGDPECQAIMMRMEDDLVPLLAAAARGERLPPAKPWTTSGRASVCVSVASGGYPGTYATGFEITGVVDASALDGVQVFHAGTARKDGALITAGGRVLGVTAVADTLPAAIARAYEGVRLIRFEGMHYRTDIGRRGRGEARRA
ncbi:MAG TPA: phosphoribosylamine--glycine ligase [Candidatus Binatia bacterium]|nr:phosphoribosylamine--glycine ligase [Candidatus Binatia bacterium]